MSYKNLIQDVPDFPKKGILFKDITPIFEDHKAFEEMIDELVEACQKFDFDKFALIESRGFLFGPALSLKTQKPFCLVRKKGKLPRETHQQTYALEYGEDCLEMHKESIQKGERLLIIDDLLATGGTASAVEKLIARGGGTPAGTLCLIELEFLKGKQHLSSPFEALITV